MWWYGAVITVVLLVGWISYQIGEAQGFRYGVHVGKMEMRDHVLRILQSVN
jgi:hypothetical protein